MKSVFTEQNQSHQNTNLGRRLQNISVSQAWWNRPVNFSYSKGWGRRIIMVNLRQSVQSSKNLHQNKKWQEGSVGKGTRCQAWWMEFDLWNPQGGRREQTWQIVLDLPLSCDLTQQTHWRLKQLDTMAHHSTWEAEAGWVLQMRPSQARKKIAGQTRPCIKKEKIKMAGVVCRSV